MTAQRPADPQPLTPEEALRRLDNDWHPVSTRPCGTCDPISRLLGEPFGCARYRIEHPGASHTYDMPPRAARAPLPDSDLAGLLGQDGHRHDLRPVCSYPGCGATLESILRGVSVTPERPCRAHGLPGHVYGCDQATPVPAGWFDAPTPAPDAERLLIGRLVALVRLGFLVHVGDRRAEPSDVVGAHYHPLLVTILSAEDTDAAIAAILEARK